MAQEQAQAPTAPTAALEQTAARPRRVGGSCAEAMLLQEAATHAAAIKEHVAALRRLLRESKDPDAVLALLPSEANQLLLDARAPSPATPAPAPARTLAPAEASLPATPVPARTLAPAEALLPATPVPVRTLAPAEASLPATPVPAAAPPMPAPASPPRTAEVVSPMSPDDGDGGCAHAPVTPLRRLHIDGDDDGGGGGAHDAAGKGAATPDAVVVAAAAPDAALRLDSGSSAAAGTGTSQPGQTIRRVVKRVLRSPRGFTPPSRDRHCGHRGKKSASAASVVP